MSSIHLTIYLEITRYIIRLVFNTHLYTNIQNSFAKISYKTLNSYFHNLLVLNWKIGKMIRVTLVKSSVGKIPTVTIELKYEIGGFNTGIKKGRA